MTSHIYYDVTGIYYDVTGVYYNVTDHFHAVTFGITHIQYDMHLDVY